MPERSPNADPSYLTTQQLFREVASLREFFESRFEAADKALLLLREQNDGLPDLYNRVSVAETQIGNIKETSVSHLHAQQDRVALALDAQKSNISIAQKVAEKAMEKAEAAADKRHLETQIEAVKENFMQQIQAARDMLQAALESAEKAIHKADEANQKRFESVNEFRSQLGDQQLTFATKSECDLRFQSANKMLDEMSVWRREVEVKFGKYQTTDATSTALTEWTGWRRGVDAALVAAQSKSTLAWAIAGLMLAAAAVIIAVLNRVSPT